MDNNDFPGWVQVTLLLNVISLLQKSDAELGQAMRPMLLQAKLLYDANVIVEGAIE